MLIHIRWMIKRDLKRVLSIEQAGFGASAWTENDFLVCLRCNRCIGMVCEYDGEVCGYMIYELHTRHFVLLKMAVDPLCRRQQMGTQMLDKLRNKLSPIRRSSIIVNAHERNLASQLFFKANGYQATKINHHFYENDGGSCHAYQMEYHLREEAVQPSLASVGGN